MSERNKYKQKYKIMVRDIILLFILFTFVALLCNNNYASRYINKKEIVVQKSNTLWTIASNICKQDDNLNIQNVILDIKRINNMKNCDIYDGQKIYIPVYDL